MANCSSCGSYIPENQGSKFCSMCVGDIGHGKDNHYLRWAEELEIKRTPPMTDTDFIMKAILLSSQAFFFFLGWFVGNCPCRKCSSRRKSKYSSTDRSAG